VSASLIPFMNTCVIESTERGRTYAPLILCWPKEAIEVFTSSFRRGFAVLPGIFRYVFEFSIL
jgi:hypothetical protein